MNMNTDGGNEGGGLNHELVIMFFWLLAGSLLFVTKKESWEFINRESYLIKYKLSSLFYTKEEQ